MQDNIFNKFEQLLRSPKKLIRCLSILFIISWIITVGTFTSINLNFSDIIKNTDNLDSVIMKVDSTALAEAKYTNKTIYQTDVSERVDLVKNYMPAFKSFYFRLFYLFFISLFFAFIGFLLILQWKNSTQELIQLEQEENKIFHIDYGLLYLACAMLIWAINTNWSLIDIHLSGKISASKYFSVIEMFLSSTNSLFFLFLIRTFKFHKEPGWQKWPILIILKKKRWTFHLYSIVVGLTLILHFSLWSTDYAVWILLPDFLFSLFTITSLFIYLYFSFQERNLSNLKWIIRLCIFLTLWGHVFTFYDLIFPNLSTDIQPCIMISYTVSLIILLLVLASSWKNFEVRKILNRRLNRIKTDKIKIDRFTKILQDRLNRIKRDTEKIERLRREMNHAVRGSLNNLYFDFTDILNNYEDYDDNKHSLLNQKIKSLKDRIKSIHLLHDVMHESQGPEGNINLKDYLPKLVEHIKNAHQYEATETDFEINIDQSFKPSIVRELGIVIVELSLNAYNAFQKKQIGKKFLGITVRRIHEDETEKMEILVSDKGPGFKPKANQPSGFGLDYVRKTVETLGGRFILPKIGIKTPLTTFRILIPLKIKSI